MSEAQRRVLPAQKLARCLKQVEIAKVTGDLWAVHSVALMTGVAVCLKLRVKFYVNVNWYGLTDCVRARPVQTEENLTHM